MQQQDQGDKSTWKNKISPNSEFQAKYNAVLRDKALLMKLAVYKDDTELHTIRCKINKIFDHYKIGS